MSRNIIFLIFTFALVTRIAGVTYGLPLWLVNDEPPFITAALKMIELKTLIPAFHQAEFAKILYYPPYFSYFLLPFFGAILLGYYLTWHEGLATFVNYLVSDLSIFFITARLLVISLSLLILWLVYKTALNIANKESAVLAVFFGASSITFLALSVVARQWIPITLVIATILWLTSRPDLDSDQKILYGLIISGLGMGVSNLLIFGPIYILLWTILIEKKAFTELVKKRNNWLAVAIFILLAVLPGLLYPQSNGFLVDLTNSQSKGFFKLMFSPLAFLKPFIFSEPILMLAALAGLLTLLRDNKRLGALFVSFIFVYSMIFYILFRFEQRFAIPIFPIFFILAGIGISECWKKISILSKMKCSFFSLAIFILLLIPILSSIQISSLLIRNDTRLQAREWVFRNIPEGSRIITYSNLFRLPTLPQAIEELRSIDKKAIRKVDLAESKIALKETSYKAYQALNLYPIDNLQILNNLSTYAKEKKYEYFLVEPDYRKNLSYGELTDARLHKKIASWEGQSNYSIATSQFEGPFYELFKTPNMGPTIKMFKLE